MTNGDPGPDRRPIGSDHPSASRKSDSWTSPRTTADPTGVNGARPTVRLVDRVISGQAAATMRSIVAVAVRVLRTVKRVASSVVSQRSPRCGPDRHAPRR